MKTLPDNHITQLLNIIDTYSPVVDSYVLHNADTFEINLNYNKFKGNEQSNVLLIIMNKLLPEINELYGEFAIIRYSGFNDVITIGFKEFNDMVNTILNKITIDDLRAIFRYGQSGNNDEPFSSALFHYIYRDNV